MLITAFKVRNYKWNWKDCLNFTYLDRPKHHIFKGSDEVQGFI